MLVELQTHVALALLQLLKGASAAVSPYCYSPSNRTLVPRAIYRSSGATSTIIDEDITNGVPTAVSLASSIFPLTLSGAGAFVVLDFGKEVGGATTLTWGAASNGSVGLSYSEASNFALCPGPSAPGTFDFFCDAPGGIADQAGSGDRSNGGSGPDGPVLTGAVEPGGSFTPPPALLRGGFR